MNPRARSVFKGWSYKSTQLTGPFQHCMFPLSHCVYPQSEETVHTGFLCRNLADYCSVRQQIPKITASLSDSSQTRTSALSLRLPRARSNINGRTWHIEFTWWLWVLKADLSSKGNQSTSWKKNPSIDEKKLHNKYQRAEKSWDKSHLSMAHFYHSLWVYMLTNKLIHGVKETFLLQFPVPFVVQRVGARSKPLAWSSSLSPTQEQPAAAHWATCTKYIPQHWTGCRLKAICASPCVDRDHLDQVWFLYWPILYTHNMWSVHHSCSCLHK